MTPQQQTRKLGNWLMGLMFNVVPGMVTCKEFDDFLVDYFDGTLTSRQNTIFELHLKFCPKCRDYLAVYKRSIELSQAILKKENDELPDNVPADLIKAILETRRS